MTVELHEKAEQELTTAFEWYERQRPGLGDAFLTEFRRAVDRMLQFPGHGRGSQNARVAVDSIAFRTESSISNGRTSS